jgi:glycosyltransferase involved in cell wall biosynthesis
MIPTYNCADYLRKTLASVLTQDPGPEVMQIEVVDDHSTEDDPEAVVAAMGGGRVGFYRQPQNVGRDRNFETCLRRSRGELVHLLHGDDWVHEGFYERLGEGMARAPEAGAAICRHFFAGADGHWESLSRLERPTPGLIDGWLVSIASAQRVATPAVVVRRSTYEHLGGFDQRLRTSEDWEMWVRIAAHYPVWFEPEPLATYRMQRPGALTHDASRETRLVEDMRRAVDVIAEYLPEHLPGGEARRVLWRARNAYADWGLDMARAGAWAGSVRRAVAHSREALACAPTPRVIALAAVEVARASYHRGRHLARTNARRIIRRSHA